MIARTCSLAVVDSRSDRPPCALVTTPESCLALYRGICGGCAEPASAGGEASDLEILEGATLKDEYKRDSKGSSGSGGMAGKGGMTVGELDAEIDALDDTNQKAALEKERAQLDKLKADVEADLEDALEGGPNLGSLKDGEAGSGDRNLGARDSSKPGASKSGAPLHCMRAAFASPQSLCGL